MFVRKNKKWASFFALLIVVSLVLSACGPAGTPEVIEKVVTQVVKETVVVESTPQVVEKVVTATPEPPEPKVLVIGLNVDPQNLDPFSNTTAAFKSVTASTIEQLVMFTQDGSEIQPCLAESWTWANDGMTLELKLKEGVKFHNGEDFNAEAAKFSIELLMEAQPYARWVGEFGSVKVVDDYTVVIDFAEPAGYALPALARGSYVYPPEYYQQVGAEGFGSEPVGTGPYQFVEWVKDDHVTFAAFPEYWGGTPRLDEIVWRVIPEPAARVAALQAGEVHLITDLSPGSEEQIKADPNLELISVSGLRKFMTFLDSRLDHPVADPTVRRALNYAVDKEGLVALFDGHAKALRGQYLTEGIAGYDPDLDPFAYDPDKAKELLAEAGYPDGFEMDLKYTIGRYPLDGEMGEAVAAYLEAVGIKVNQIPLEYGEFRRQFYEEFMGPAFQWAILPPADPHMTLVTFDEGSQFTRYPDDPRVFELIDAGRRETDLDERVKIHRELLKIWNEEPLGIYLIVTNDLYAIRKGVTGFEPGVMQVVYLVDVDLEQ